MSVRERHAQIGNTFGHDEIGNGTRDVNVPVEPVTEVWVRGRLGSDLHIVFYVFAAMNYAPTVGTCHLAG